MSWNHQTVGFERYEDLLRLLRFLGVRHTEELQSESYVRGWDGICACQGYCNYDSDHRGFFGDPCSCCKGTCEHKQKLRIARFTLIGRQLVAEEYLAIDDRDGNGTSAIEFALYETAIDRTSSP